MSNRSSVCFLVVLFLRETLQLVDQSRTNGRALNGKLSALPNNYTGRGSGRRSASAAASLPANRWQDVKTVSCLCVRVCVYVCVFLFAGPRTSFPHPGHHLSASRSSVARPGCRLPLGPAVASGLHDVPATSRSALQPFFTLAQFSKRRRRDLRASCHLSFAKGTCDTLCGTLLFCAGVLVAGPIFGRSTVIPSGWHQ